MPAVALAILLAVCLFTYYYTRDSERPAAPRQKSAAAERQALVDTSLLQTALKLAPLAATADEQRLAHEAWRLADHELDLTFAAALRAAEAEAGTALPAGGPLRQLSDRVNALNDRVEADKKRVEALTKQESDDLDLAQAELVLDQDELDDAQQDLAREGGDKRAKLKRLLQEHEASEKSSEQNVKYATQGDAGAMIDQLRSWLALGEYDRQLQAATQLATAHAQTLLVQHGALEQQLPAQRVAAASVARLRQLSEQHKTLAGLDQRAQDTRQLAAVYQDWSALVEGRQRTVLHVMLRSLGLILLILLVAVLLDGGMRHVFRRTDRHRHHQLRVIARTSLQLVSVLLILLVVFGVPMQVSTMIGLVTAGFTVVMKDFIVAFFGWFLLMGKNGISVGDWVEIDGVSGEVIEIGLLKTVVLELGNWTEMGHPTGRRVTFSNSFAMDRHYFNFSTSSQWLWDELRFPLPPSDDPYQAAREVQKIVEMETQSAAAEAAKDWQGVALQHGTREFSAVPSVSLRPGANGLELVVRYITRAPRRNAVKAKLLRSVVELLHKSV